MVDEEDVKSWDVLWNPKYKGEIQMLDSVRDTMGIFRSDLVTQIELHRKLQK